MQLVPITVPGVAGDLTATYSFWSGFRFSVNAERVRPHGFPRNRLTLPGTAGPVEAKVKGGFLRAFPSIVVDGVEYPMGPPTPGYLQALALLPLLSILLIQGGIGFGLAFGAVALNMGYIRGYQSDAAKALLLATTFITVGAIDALVLVAVLND